MTALSQVCPCTPGRPLHLRGLCPDSTIDRVLVASNRREGGQLAYHGLASTLVHWLPGQGWRLQVLGGNTTATSSATQLSFLLGRHPWKIQGECDEVVELKLTGCEEGEFTCDDGQCVTMEQRCDKVAHCGDGSDELDCRVLVQGKTYSKLLPPVPSPSNLTVPVTISLVLESVRKLDEVNHILEIQFQMQLEWYESTRMVYHNLKTDQNILTHEDVKSMWLPQIMIKNSFEESRQEAVVKVVREGVFVRSPFHILHEVDEFQGPENRLVMKQNLHGRFHCSFNLLRYPFDSQVLDDNLVNTNLFTGLHD